MSSQVVSYTLDDRTVVQFEIEASGDFHPVGAEQAIGRVRDAVEPAVLAAKSVLDQVRAMKPGQVELKFGIKVNGTANWLVAKAATEANFEVTLSWSDSAEVQNPS
ncbi:MAG TPA: CU044_2847 family protein [Streptomyces sp.]|uniref:CU044_2847 family protein n=1 Tax=unclassified Streptomyces TaxID=2593676 RepID=UPI002C426567|nr:CU044_2847 family protein [Streptomyces sp.]HWU08791.1 CU044_2847 family protein [Streptomyces sp.]